MMKNIYLCRTTLLTIFFGCIVLLVNNAFAFQSAPFPIYYGLNESHSNSWAQITENGVVGITVFEHNNSTHTTGNLVYKTVQPNGNGNTEVITSGTHLENSVLLYDSQSRPHIFAASSNNSNQFIKHYYKNQSSQWTNETIINFYNEGGKFIYELSADISPNGSFHLLVLKTRSNPDSDDYYFANLNSYLFHLSNSSGTWQKELLDNFDTIFTMDEYSKMMNRQDIKVDKNGYVHIIYGEQINASDWNNSPDRLQYATNKSGDWVFETAVNYPPNTRYSVAWYPSLCLDTLNNPHVSCCYIGRVPTGSAMYAKLLFVSRTNDHWVSETVCEYDDGYYGGDGRDYTGGHTHLVFDNHNTPHIIFSDIASSHGGMNYFNLGNIRYATKNNSEWAIRKIHQHPLPEDRYNATEIYDMCLLINNNNGKIQVAGQELQVSNMSTYTCSLVHYDVTEGTQIIPDNELLNKFILHQNYPNPFNPATTISYVIPETTHIQLNIYNINGQLIKSLVNKIQIPGNYTKNWDGTNQSGEKINSGIYVYNLVFNKFNISKKMLFLK